MIRPRPATVDDSAPLTPDLLDTLDQAWQTICDAYDAVAERPDLPVLLPGVNLAQPDEAAETLLANMLLAATDSISRFSPWYRRPLGLQLTRDPETGRTHWGLSPTSREQWEVLLTPLAAALRQSVALFLAADVLDGLAPALPPGRVMAGCLCVPARVILIQNSVLLNAEIMCDTCRQPFRALAPRDCGGEPDPPW